MGTLAKPPRRLHHSRYAAAVSTARHQPSALRDPITLDAGDLIAAARRGKLVLYLGAGVSAAEPTLGPMGSTVADKLRGTVASMLACDETTLSGDTLEDLAERVAASGGAQLGALRALAVEVCRFRDLQPNYSHRAVARLMDEGLAHVITTNWDCAIEQAGMAIGLTISPITNDLDNQTAHAGIPLYKVHGTATRPDGLRITNAEVNQPLDWAVAQTRTYMSSGTTVFAGLGTVGSYVADPIIKILREWSGYSDSVRIAAPDFPAAWRAILGNSAEGAHVPMHADDFFDNLLRAIVREALTTATTSARLLAQAESWAKPILDEVVALEHELGSHAADPILAWWRGCGIPSSSGTPFILTEGGVNALLAVGYIAQTGGGLHFETHGGTLIATTDDEYVEIINWPGAHVAEVSARATEHALWRSESGVFRDGRPTCFAVSGARGRFPSLIAEPDIATGDAHRDDIAGESARPVRLVSVEDAVQGRLAP